MTIEGEQTVPPPQRGRGPRLILGIAVLVTLVGALLAAWLAHNWRTWQQGHDAMEAAANPAETNQSGTTPEGVPALAAPGTAADGNVDVQAARVAELEQRLTRISLSAQAASYNANRAEALLTAFAARRALDAGRSLGYVEGTLRIRFGDAQPKAVATIINAAAEPVTLATLRLGLEDISAVGRYPGSQESWLAGFWREIGSIAILRKAGAPSPEPEQRLIRARRALDLGQVDAAIDEMLAMPRQAAIDRWLEIARRYNEAHRALDVIEAAAILEPRTTPALDLPAAPAQAAPAEASNAAAAPAPEAQH